jgi:hypothetical protein
MADQGRTVPTATSTIVLADIDRMKQIAPLLPAGYIRILLSAAELVAQKNIAYADAWKEQGWRGNLARVMSKNARLRNMLWRRVPVVDEEEPVERTMLDAINLLAFMGVNLRLSNEWGSSNGQGIPE